MSEMTKHWRKLNMMRDHRWAEPRLSEYLDGELPARQLRRLRGHEQICPECRAALEALRKIIATLPELLPRSKARTALAEQTASAVLARIERENGGPGGDRE